MHNRLLAFIAALALVSTGCSVNLSIGGENPADAAVNVIEGDIADLIDLGPITATCESPESVEVGTTWGCSGVSDAGNIDFSVEVDREDHINVQTENVILGDQVVALANSATEVVEEAVDVDLADGAVDCGTSSIILLASAELSCTVDTGTELVPTTVTITNLDDTSFEVDLDPLEGKFGVDFGARAVQLIEGELADGMGLGPVAAQCDSPPSNEVGTTWNCEGTVDGQVATFVALIDREDNVSVNSTNVIPADQVSIVSDTAMRQLNESVGGSLPDEAMDCGDVTIILPASNEFICGLDVGTDVYDATITITDPSVGGFEVVVADTPRS